MFSYKINNAKGKLKEHDWRNILPFASFQIVKQNENNIPNDIIENNAAPTIIAMQQQFEALWKCFQSKKNRAKYANSIQPNQ